MQGSQRQKKVTVKFFLNEAVEPAKGEGSKLFYPLYVQVTYNRRNMQFRSRYGEYYHDLEEVKPALMQFEEQILCAIIRYEAGVKKGEYDLKGLKQKYTLYSLSILEAIEDYLKPKVRLAVLKIGNELAGVLNFADPTVTVSQLYKAAKLLFKRFDEVLPEKLMEDLKAYEIYQNLERPVLTYNFPTLIEWVDGSYKAQLEQKLAKDVKTKVDMITQIKNLVDRAVKTKLKELSG